MKEIGIEKLVELLNEYDSSNGWKETDEGIDNIWKIYEFHSELQIISKKYGFIKWLVENDKIDRDKVKEVFGICRCCGNVFMMHFEYCDACGDRYFTGEEELLMLLSISDTPIEDLILYLKFIS